MKRRHSEDALETPVASLIDVVFLLIIFFVVTATVEKEVIDQTIQLAAAKHSAAAVENDPRTITINIRKDGEINIAKMYLTPRMLKQILVATLRDTGNQAVPILLRCDGDAPYEKLAAVQEIVAAAGYYRIKLAAIAGSGK